MRSSKPALAAALVLLSGCSLAPDYHRPAVAAADAYKEVPTGWTVASPAADASPASWWEAFGDPVLNGLEGRIEAGSPSLAAAVARYDQAIGALREAKADLYPQISANGGAQRDRAPANRPLATTGRSVTYNEYQLGGSFDWEIDLFGRVRNSIKANKGEAQASAADVAGVRLGLQTSLATAYFRMRGLDAREGLLKQTVEAYQKAYDLTDVRHQGGVASGLDTSRARAQLASARAELIDIHAQRAAFEHAIAVLVGEPATTFSVAADPKQNTPPSFPTGTPSTLLQRRPDIDAAERRVYAANARIGVAKAALYPSLSLGGGGGYETTGPNLLSAASNFWALGPASLALSLFDGGARAARVRISRAEFAEASANYKQTVLTAFKEVEDDLATGRDLVQEERDERDAAQAAETTRDLAFTRYRDGASDYLEVVTAQTAALDAERSLLDLHTRQLTTAVDTVHSLGGVVK
ncbi:efflux transporter outer membrane subunit [Sphingomonas abietis]|uniref:Efflux transporter outer membrane subunit n=1 Tax=Sphingomonas abietis TaxID=3012344 RepID=A0ABY7NJH8_9SPHN|nr:efflux transporter outer membrane subunit [Sphingomonas abietis]WBO20788.1 efflux transporter outer membrane subunit [Sphingomonas abietis]